MTATATSQNLSNIIVISSASHLFYGQSMSEWISSMCRLDSADIKRYKEFFRISASILGRIHSHMTSLLALGAPVALSEAGPWNFWTSGRILF